MKIHSQRMEHRARLARLRRSAAGKARVLVQVFAPGGLTLKGASQSRSSACADRGWSTQVDDQRLRSRHVLGFAEVARKAACLLLL